MMLSMKGRDGLPFTGEITEDWRKKGQTLGECPAWTKLRLPSFVSLLTAS